MKDMEDNPLPQTQIATHPHDTKLSFHVRTDIHFHIFSSSFMIHYDYIIGFVNDSIGRVSKANFHSCKNSNYRMLDRFLFSPILDSCGWDFPLIQKYSSL